jgi:hypothetical protein
MLKTVFWQRAAQALPPAVRGRHLKHLERAERIESVIAAAVELCRRVGRAFGRRAPAELLR